MLTVGARPPRFTAKLLLTTFLASKPQLLHSNSKRSIAASDDYYSLSEQSEPSSGDDQTTVIRYQTPPSRKGSGQAFREQREQPKARTESSLGVHQEASAVEEASGVRFDEKSYLPKEPQSADHMKTWNESKSYGSPPTPGNDDTPYIQFAIDQLTRDEELLGRSRDRSGSPDISPITDEESGHLPEGESLQKGPRVPPKTATPHHSQSISSLSEDRSRNGTHVLIPAHPPQDHFRYPPLNFVPGPLRLLPLGALAAFCVVLISLLIVSCVRAARSEGLILYDGVGTSRYFLVQYFPQLLAVIIIVWLQVVQAAIQRILPFVLLSQENQNPRKDILSDIPLYTTNYLIPDQSLLRHGGPLLRFCSTVFWLNLFTVPLASSLYQTKYYGSGNGTWTWTTVQPIAIILIFLYTTLTVALIFLCLRFSRHTTGLKWDPISLADIFVLLRSASNSAFARNSYRPDFIGSRPASLGYWESTSHPGAIIHGIAAAKSPSRMQVEKGKAIRHGADDLEAQGPPQASTFESWQSSSRTRPQPWFLRETYIILFPIIAIVLVIAFIAASFTRSALINGFSPLLPSGIADSSFTNFSSSNFLYSFLPAFLATLLPLFWHPIDTAFRYLQPFASLSARSGATAESSLLLSYPAAWPLLVTVRAALAGHFRVAWFSLLSIIAWVIPILAGGLFTAQWVASPANNESSEILMRVDPGALYALVAFTLLYALSWALIFPGQKRRMGGGLDMRYLSDIREVVGERLLRDQMWREPRGRIDLVTRLVSEERGRKFTGGERRSGRWGMSGGRVVIL